MIKPHIFPTDTRAHWPMLLWLVFGPLPLIVALAFHSHPAAANRPSIRAQVIGPAENVSATVQTPAKAEQTRKAVSSR